MKGVHAYAMQDATWTLSVEASEVDEGKGLKEEVYDHIVGTA